VLILYYALKRFKQLNGCLAEHKRAASSVFKFSHYYLETNIGYLH